ncbi:hypothetical protein KSS87_021208, partial [Heliosperma pusillum]
RQIWWGEVKSVTAGISSSTDDFAAKDELGVDVVAVVVTVTVVVSIVGGGEATVTMVVGRSNDEGGVGDDQHWFRRGWCIRWL